MADFIEVLGCNVKAVEEIPVSKSVAYQFVEFSAFFRKESGRFDREALAQQVLAEIPHQLVGWMNNNNIDPEGVKRRQN